MRRSNRILAIGLSAALGGVLAASLAGAKDGEATDAEKHVSGMSIVARPAPPIF